MSDSFTTICECLMGSFCEAYGWFRALPLVIVGLTVMLESTVCGKVPLGDPPPYKHTHNSPGCPYLAFFHATRFKNYRL